MVGLISPIIAGLALVWGIWKFVVEKRDEAVAAEQRSIHSAIELQKAYLEKEVYDLKAKLGKQEDEFQKMKLTVVSLTQQTKNQGQTFNDTIHRVEKTLDRHEQKLDNFGKVIVKD